ncbi:MAG: acylphosphatase [Acidobacteria bacterium]|nr:MAG: acylphosphatase [Acidobacteriota bacterium]PYQ20990.1 MAG: acylphosphatase [Acidobacteriota bacterium]
MPTLHRGRGKDAGARVAREALPKKRRCRRPLNELGSTSVAAYRYLVAGRVQGVGYRYFVLREAEALGIAGFARNLSDGRVEVLAEGADEALGRFESRLREGPAFASVTGVERIEAPTRGGAGFHIR